MRRLRVGFEREHGDGYEGREDDEGDDQVDPERGAPDVVGDVAFDAPPDEGLVELVGAEQERESGEQEMVVASPKVAADVDADRPHHEPAYDVGLR